MNESEGKKRPGCLEELRETLSYTQTMAEIERQVPEEEIKSWPFADDDRRQPTEWGD